MGAGLSQEKLAEGAGLHPTYISMIERGVRNPTLDSADRIAKALKITLPVLIEEAQSSRGNAEIVEPVRNNHQKPHGSSK